MLPWPWPAPLRCPESAGLVSALDREFRPTGQRGRSVVQEYDPARFGERQIRGERAVVDGELLQDLPVVLVGGVQPGAFRGKPAAPAVADLAGAALARSGAILVQPAQVMDLQSHALPGRV